MRSTLNLINSGLFNINYIIPHEPLIAFLCVLDFKAVSLHGPDWPLPPDPLPRSPEC